MDTNSGVSGDKVQIGQRRFRLVVIGNIAGKWHVRCDCGKEKWLYTSNFYSAKSCGCLRDENNKMRNIAYYRNAFPMWSKKPCPKCNGKMEVKRYFSCLRCTPFIEDEHWLGDVVHSHGDAWPLLA